MSNKKKNNSGYKPAPSSHNKATRITVLVLAFLMVAGILVTMVGLIITAIIGDDHDHDHEDSKVVVYTTASSNKGTTDVKPSSSSNKADSSTDAKPTESTNNAGATGDVTVSTAIGNAGTTDTSKK